MLKQNPLRIDWDTCKKNLSKQSTSISQPIIDGFCLNIAKLIALTWIVLNFLPIGADINQFSGYKGIGNKIIPGTGPNFGGQDRGPYTRNRVYLYFCSLIWEIWMALKRTNPANTTGTLWLLALLVLSNQLRSVRVQLATFCSRYHNF